MEQDRKKMLLFEEGSRDAEHQLLRAKIFLEGQKGDIDSLKLMQEIHAREKYDALIANIDNDEYEFADETFSP